jgi:hypothetical protein
MFPARSSISSVSPPSLVPRNSSKVELTSDESHTVVPSGAAAEGDLRGLDRRRSEYQYGWSLRGIGIACSHKQASGFGQKKVPGWNSMPEREPRSFAA